MHLVEASPSSQEVVRGPECIVQHRVYRLMHGDGVGRQIDCTVEQPPKASTLYQYSRILRPATRVETWRGISWQSAPPSIQAGSEVLGRLGGARPEPAGPSIGPRLMAPAIEAPPSWAYLMLGYEVDLSDCIQQRDNLYFLDIKELPPSYHNRPRKGKSNGSFLRPSWEGQGDIRPLSEALRACEIGHAPPRAAAPTCRQRCVRATAMAPLSTQH